MSFRNMTLLIGIPLIVWLFDSDAIAQRQSEDGEYVDAGFVFYDGEYVNPPYLVEVRDLSVFVSGFQITPTPYIRESLVVTEDPGVPEGLSKDIGLDGFDAIRWQGRMPYHTAKLAYLWRRYEEEEAQDRMMAYYRSLPFLREVERIEEDLVKVTDFAGNSRVIELYISPLAMRPPASEEELQAQAQRLADMLKERLRKGDCYLFFENGTELSMTERKAVNVLRELRDVVMDASKSSSAKTGELLTLGIVPPHDRELAESLVFNFKRDSQFDARLESLQAKIAEQYGEQAIHDVMRGSE